MSYWIVANNAEGDNKAETENLLKSRVGQPEGRKREAATSAAR